MPPPPPGLRRSPQPWNTLPFWLAIGLVFSVIQFAASEVLYRMSMYADTSEDTTLTDLSDVIAWPAGDLFDAVLQKQYQQGLEQVAAEQSPFTEPQRSEARALLQHFPDPEDDEIGEMDSFLWDIPEVQDYTLVSPLTEYSLYIGTCLAWGLLIALGGYLLFHRKEEPVL
jgi:hypothetical protein